MQNKSNINKRKIAREKNHRIIPSRLEGVVKNKMMNPILKKKETKEKIANLVLDKKEVEKGKEIISPKENMNISIKATHIQLTLAIRERINIICSKLEKIINAPYPGSSKYNIEIEKITEHHKKGNIFRAEINLTIIGKYFRAVASSETIFSALEEAYIEMKREVMRLKDRQKSEIRKIRRR